MLLAESGLKVLAQGGSSAVVSVAVALLLLCGVVAIDVDGAAGIPCEVISFQKDGGIRLVRERKNRPRENRRTRQVAKKR